MYADKINFLFRNVRDFCRHEYLLVMGIAQKKTKSGIKMSKKNQHVVPHGDDWAVKGAGNSKATSVYPTQAEAIDRARGIAQNQKSELLIHGENGRIREKNSYGNDPFPPKG
ncbi:MAG: DUF2188 domain-containing protein [Methylococcaceae bacterium]